MVSCAIFLQTKCHNHQNSRVTAALSPSSRIGATSWMKIIYEDDNLKQNGELLLPPGCWLLAGVRCGLGTEKSYEIFLM